MRVLDDNTAYEIRRQLDATGRMTRKPGGWDEVQDPYGRGTINRADLAKIALDLSEGYTKDLPIPAYTSSELWDSGEPQPLDDFIVGLESIDTVFYLVREGELYIVDTSGYSYCRYIAKVI